MTDSRGIKTDNSLKNEERKHTQNASESNTPLASVKLERNSADNYSPAQFYVLPARGMHLAVPDLEFHNSHFANSSESLASDTTKMLTDFKAKPQNFMNTNMLKKSSAAESVKQESHKGSRLPFGLEITAGPGQRKLEKEGLSKRAPLPSQTFLASMELFKSYFISSQDKDPPHKGEPANDNELSVKNKVMGIWHNMKYGWSANMKTNFSRDTPIYLLGRIYHKTFKEEEKSSEDTSFLCSNIEGFKKDFTSLAWFTYRRKFPPLPESNLTTDCGWGCMIRSGQMMMHTALRRHFLPCSWRYGFVDGPQASIHKQIIKFFCDDPSPNCPFSLHNLILCGHKMNKRAGNWYGPSCVAHMIRDAVEESSKHIAALKRIGVYVAQDGAVYVQDILDMCSVDVCVCRNPPLPSFVTVDGAKLVTKSNSLLERDKRFQRTVSRDEGHLCEVTINSPLGKSLYPSLEPLESSSVKTVSAQSSVVPLDLFVDMNREKREKEGASRPFGDAVAMRLKESPSEHDPVLEQSCSQCLGWKSCVIFIPVRLGGAAMNPIYRNCIYSLFLHDLCIGIIGGRPKHSLYFVGFQDESLVHLDPHLSQDAVPMDSADFPLESYHCVSPRKLNISKMDPSATIGFYCHTRSQFYRLLEEAPLIAVAKDGNLDSPIFEFVDGRSKDVNGWIERNLSEGDEPRMSFCDTPPTGTSPTYISSMGILPEDTDTSTSTEEEETEELVFD